MPKGAHFEENSKRSPRQNRRISRQLKSFFGGDALVHDSCRSFTRAELDLLRRGVSQRGEAIRRFLEDHLSGQKHYLRKRLMTLSTAKRIFKRNPVPPLSPNLATQQLQFFYGPDVIRDPKGRFRVLEDNAGYVGGFGDLDAFQKAAEIIRGTHEPKLTRDPFYAKMVALAKKQAKRFGNQKILLLSYPRMHRSNREDHRFAAILEAFGIKEITSTQGLKVKGQKLFHQGERVSFLITNVLVKDIEALEPGASIHFFSSPVDGFWDAYQHGGFGLSSHPAAECASDKELYLYVEKMIRFYLKEAPLIPNIRARSLASQKIRDTVFSNLSQWVIKSAIGHGGRQVWIGKTVSLKRAEQLRRQVAERPHDFMAQAFTKLSQLEGYSVDARPLTIISPEEPIVSELPWGRGALASKPRKVNLCSGGLFIISEQKRS